MQLCRYSRTPLHNGFPVAAFRSVNPVRSLTECISFLLAAFAQFVLPKSYITHGAPWLNHQQVEKHTSRRHRTRSRESSLPLRVLSDWKGHLTLKRIGPLSHPSIATSATVTSPSTCFRKAAAIRKHGHALAITLFQLRSSIDKDITLVTSHGRHRPCANKPLFWRSIS